MKAFAVFAAILAVSSASPQIIYNSGFGGLASIGLASHTHIPHAVTYNAPLAAVRTAIAAPAIAHAHPAIATPLAAAPIAVAAATKTQYHSQDELGQAVYGHSEPTQAHHAVRDASGGVSGTFSYISREGIPLTTHYRADQNGYRVASNALPVNPGAIVQGPSDTPAVLAAKIQHAAAHAEARARSGRKKRGLIAAPGIATPLAALGAHPALISHPGAITYAAVSVPAVRPAILTQIHNNPGHAVSYRVD